jgi:uncharacterized membrane protein YjjP (DUF1212 family)
VSEPASPDAQRIEEIAQRSPQVGRLLLQNGADTERVEAGVAHFAMAFGGEANLMVSYEALLLTLVAGNHFRTKIGHRMPAMNVGMTAIEAVNRVVHDVEIGRRGLADAGAELDAVEHRPTAYAPWLVVVALGLTAASLRRLFGGDWATFLIAGLAGAAGTWLRQILGRRHFNPIVIPFAAACLSGIVGGGAVLLGASRTPVLCLVAPAMIMVPGVPLINSVQDMIKNHMTLGLSRLGFRGLVTAQGSGCSWRPRLPAPRSPLPHQRGPPACPKTQYSHPWRRSGMCCCSTFGCAWPGRAWSAASPATPCGRCSFTSGSTSYRDLDRRAGGKLPGRGICSTLPGTGCDLRLSRRRRYGAGRLRLPRGHRQPGDRARDREPAACGRYAGARHHCRAHGRGNRRRRRRPGAVPRPLRQRAGPN